MVPPGQGTGGSLSLGECSQSHHPWVYKRARVAQQPDSLSSSPSHGGCLWVLPPQAPAPLCGHPSPSALHPPLEVGPTQAGHMAGWMDEASGRWRAGWAGGESQDHGAGLWGGDSPGPRLGPGQSCDPLPVWFCNRCRFHGQGCVRNGLQPQP